MEAIQAALLELQAEVQRQHDEIAFLRSRTSRPKPSLPDPEKFSGQAHKYDTWLPSIKAKLRVDGEAIGDTIAQFYYVYLNLDSHVQAMVLPQLSQAEDSESWDYRTILQQLSRVYDNPNKVQEAEDKLFALKQGSDSIPTYTAKFERVLYEARGQDWPDVNKISTFRNGLNSTIRSRLAQQLSLPRSYAEFVRIVQQLAGSSSSSGFSSYGRQHSTPHGQTDSHKPAAGDAMDIGYIGLIDKEQPTSPSRAQSVSPSQRDQLRKQGRCVRCSSHDHWVAQCPLQPHKPGKVTVMAINDDDDGDSSSEQSTHSWNSRDFGQGFARHMYSKSDA
jgi:hypothetical protein